MPQPTHQPTEPVQYTPSATLDWTPLNEPGISGISIKVLRRDPATGRPPTFLLKFEPGATYPAHTHPAGEEVYVLEGEVHFGKHHLRPGDYLYTPPNGIHAVRSPAGCVLLLVVPEEVVILKP
ncbi:MAG: cupin domain-containing protein [Acidobacteria bacterium]|nr:cupin domain-containing protein [Acidobacteriota bacterium]